jgi:hypothetical protein
MATSLAEYLAETTSPEGQLRKIATELDQELEALTDDQVREVYAAMQAEKQAELAKEAEEEKRAEGAFMGEGFYATLEQRGLREPLQKAGEFFAEAEKQGVSPADFVVMIAKSASLYDSLEEASAKQPQQ